MNTRYVGLFGFGIVGMVSVIAGCDATNTAIEHVWFEHIGWQGKPMPEFCVTTASAASGEYEKVLVSAETLVAVLSLCERAQDNVAVSDPGTYRWKADGDPPKSGVIGPRTMVEIVNVIRRDAADHGRRVPDLVERLAMRLGV